MSSPIDGISSFRHETAVLEPVPPATLRMRGEIAIQEPSKVFRPYLKTLHEAAITSGAKELEVDVVELTFVNSSAIRLFVDWATWVAQAGKPYQLVFRTNGSSTWQRSTFKAISSLVGDAVRIVS